MSVLVNRTDLWYLLPAMISDGVLTAETAGYLLAIGNFTYLLGKLSTGFAVDSFGGRKSFTVALSLATVFSALFAIPVGTGTPAFLYLCACWATNRYFQSACWPSMAQLIRNWMLPAQWGATWGAISTSSRSGSLLATAVVGGLLAHGMEWRMVVLLCALFLAVALLLNLFFLRNLPSAASDTSASNEPEGEVSLPAVSPSSVSLAAPRLPVKQLLRKFWGDPRFVWICVSVAALDLVLEFESFVALFLQQWFSLTPSTAALLTGFFPLGATVSVIVGGVLMDRLEREKDKSMRFLDVSLALTSVCCGALVLLFAVAQETPSTAVLVLVLMSLFLLGLFLGFPCYLPMNLYGLSFGQAECGVLVSLIDACGYTACIVFDYAVGTLVGRELWLLVLVLVLGCALVGLGATHRFMSLEVALSNMKVEADPVGSGRVTGGAGDDDMVSMLPADNMLSDEAGDLD
jgi:sugar phosphate permease